MARKGVSKDVEVEVFRRCRRRCCICYGLNRDDSIKDHGQIAHLDKNPSNSAIENLAFLCLEHHAQYDSRTSQSKNLTLQEVRGYRNELENRFSTWGLETNHLLNFLADYVDVETMADGAEKIAARYVWYHRQLAIEALTQDEVCSSDTELYIPFLAVLGDYRAWGWLTYSADEESRADEGQVMHIRVTHKPICAEVARVISDRRGRTNPD